MTGLPRLPLPSPTPMSTSWQRHPQSGRHQLPGGHPARALLVLRWWCRLLGPGQCGPCLELDQLAMLLTAERLSEPERDAVEAQLAALRALLEALTAQRIRDR